MSSVASLPLLYSRTASMPNLSVIQSEVLILEEEEKKKMRENIEKEQQQKQKQKKQQKDECTEIKKKDEFIDEGCPYVSFVAEEDMIGSEYYLHKQWLHCSPSDIDPLYSIHSPETITLLSDSVVVLDTEREIFIWIGGSRAVLKEDDVFNHCLSLALSLTKERNPPSIIRVVREYSSNSRFVLCNLIPSHKDPMDVATKTISVFSAYSPMYLKDHFAKFMHTDDMSFREYMAMIYRFR